MLITDNHNDWYSGWETSAPVVDQLNSTLTFFLCVSTRLHNRLCAISGWTHTNKQTDSLKVDQTCICGWANIDWMGFVWVLWWSFSPFHNPCIKGRICARWMAAEGVFYGVLDIALRLNDNKILFIPWRITSTSVTFFIYFIYSTPLWSVLPT